MASLQKVRVGDRTYWRIVESRRVNGKPRAVPILHLGTADALLNRLLQVSAGQFRIQSFQHGEVAALKAVADRLQVVATIDRHVTAGHTRPCSVGTTLLVAAINRAVQPRSKRGWAGWAVGTSLLRLFPGLEVQRLTSQYFWDQMDGVEVAALRAIEDDLTRTVVAELGIELDTLFYDTTNFFTYIASTNERSPLTRRGHSKQKRHDLRLFNLALLVSRVGQIPLCAQVYEGNRVDVTHFPESLTRIRERLEALSLSLTDITLVYDKGNHSKANQALVDEAPFGYVASLVPTQHPELLAISARDYHPLGDSRLGAIARLRLRRELWGRERTVLLFISESLRAGQRRGLQHHLSKRLRQLAEWQAHLAKPRSGPRSRAAARKRIDQLLTGQYLNRVLKVDYDPERPGAERLHYEVDATAVQYLEAEVFGKRMLITDRQDWSDEEILLAYRGQSQVEGTFRQLKDDEHLAVRPQYHWTAQKVHVHTFICLVGLLLARVIEYEARRLGYRQGLSGLLELLGTVRLAMVLQPASAQGGRPRCHWQLEQAEPDALRLFQHLVPAQEPFVYT